LNTARLLARLRAATLPVVVAMVPVTTAASPAPNGERFGEAEACSERVAQHTDPEPTTESPAPTDEPTAPSAEEPAPTREISEPANWGQGPDVASLTLIETTPLVVEEGQDYGYLLMTRAVADASRLGAPSPDGDCPDQLRVVLPNRVGPSRRVVVSPERWMSDALSEQYGEEVCLYYWETVIVRPPLGRPLLENDGGAVVAEPRVSWDWVAHN